MKELILGGARSGKSAYAEERARQSGLAVHYVATATAGDAEMAERIAQHRRRRPPEWGLSESPLNLAETLERCAAPGRLLLVDCLTLWAANLLAPDREARWAEERERLLAALPGLPGAVVMVSNETGLGVVPMGAMTRRFVDETGLLHQALARLCDRVTLVAAGLPLCLKGMEP